jgi:hypothetical protein
MPTSERPRLLEIPLPVVESLPPEMREATWVTWRAKWRCEKNKWKLAKIPCDGNGRSVGFADPSTIGTLSQALKRADSLRSRIGTHFGVGISFARPCDPWILDLDGELAEAPLPPRLTWLCSEAPTWAEVSVSGSGLHLVYKGGWTVNRKLAWRGRPAELIGSNKFVAITGAWWDQSLCSLSPAGPLRTELEELLTASAARSPFGPAGELSDDEVLRLMLSNPTNGAAISALWNGNASAFGNDQSRADMALCAHLAFWFGPSESRIDAMFRRSRLMRPKWDEKHYRDGRTYGAATIAKALEGRTEFFDRRSRCAASANGKTSSASPSSPEQSREAQQEPLPRIWATRGDLAEVTRQAWSALQQANDPPTLFRYGAIPVRIEDDDDGNPITRAMTPERVRHRLARVAQWYTVVKSGDGMVEKAVHPPKDIVADVLATPDPPLPILTRIVRAPIFAGDGTLQTKPGYSPASKTFFVASSGLIIPDVTPRPSATETQKARQLLADELIGDFPFVSETDKAHAVAALLLPFARELIEGPTPLHDFEAPGPGTGKTLLVNAITVPVLGHPATAMTEGKDDEEWRKRLLAKLFTAPSVVLIDNVRRRADAGSLASALIAWPLWEDRLLGKSEIISVPNRCVWLMTANNPAFSSEMTRRTIRIRLDAKQDQPWLRTGFRHPFLVEWARSNRGSLIWASLTLIQSWIAEGRPEGDGRLGMYEQWARVMGGILDVAGIPGFLGNLQEFYAHADAEGAAWRVFIADWHAHYGTREVRVADVFPLAVDAGMELGEKGEQSQKSRLGKKIAEARDRVFRVSTGEQDDQLLRIVHAGTQKRVHAWRLAVG